MNTHLSSQSSLEDWLAYIESQHGNKIDLGLERVAEVAAKLNIEYPSSKVVTVAGTNGKGTTSACLEQLCLAEGKSVAVYSSPHLLRYEERVRVNGKDLEPTRHAEAFYQVEMARGETSLTYFEYGTLAGLWLAMRANCDVVILEVGLGGRLDAVNIIDADIAVITTVDIDHIDWLGDNREIIGREKAGILRSECQFVCGDPKPPQSVIEHAKELGCSSYYSGNDFSYSVQENEWVWESNQTEQLRLPLPFIPVQNAATALQVFKLISDSADPTLYQQAMLASSLPGRFQLVQQSPRVVLDVAHNPQACGLLLSNLNRVKGSGRCIAVVAMLGDKDIAACLSILDDVVDLWCIADLNNERAASAAQIQQQLQNSDQSQLFESVSLAYDSALKQAAEEDTVIVMGSFFTVAEVLENLG